MNVTPEMVIQLIMGLGVIPALFVYLLLDTRKEHRDRLAESIAREQALMEHIQRSDETQREITNSISKTSETMAGIEKNLMLIQKDVENLKKG